MSNYRPVPWQRNFRKIPAAIRFKIQGQQGEPVTVGGAWSFPLAQLQNGIYSHLGISVEEGTVCIPPGSVIPPADMGRWSRTNIEGYEEVRRDLPKTIKTISVDTPNWGDWANGSHTIEWDREVYQRDYIPPKEVALQIEVLGRDPAGQAYIIRFCTEEILNPTDPDFEDDLLYNLNLLQENIGRVDVNTANATRDVCVLPTSPRETRFSMAYSHP